MSNIDIEIQRLEEDCVVLRNKIKNSFHNDFWHDADKYSIELAEKKARIKKLKEMKRLIIKARGERSTSAGALLMDKIIKKDE